MGDPLAEWTSSSISGSLHKLTLAKLQPDSLYEVEMAAKNCAGLGQPAMMTFRTGRGTTQRLGVVAGKVWAWWGRVGGATSVANSNQSHLEWLVPPDWD